MSVLQVDDYPLGEWAFACDIKDSPVERGKTPHFTREKSMEKEITAIGL